jgi:hypothetical protein
VSGKVPKGYLNQQFTKKRRMDFSPEYRHAVGAIQLH